MKLNEDIHQYLAGEKFSNQLIIRYPYYEAIPNRIQFFTVLAAKKKVIHMGCLDHLPLIEQKILNGQWAHKAITESASVCIGIDIDEKTKDYVETHYGYANILLGDFTKKKFPQLASHHWDYAILGEVLEHIDNPVAYLQSIRALYADGIDKLVITVPNAWSQTAMRMANQSAEIINSDHRYWFTPYTLAKVILQAGLRLEEFHFANRVPLRGMNLIKNKLAKIFGFKLKFNYTYASSIIAIAKLN